MRISVRDAETGNSIGMDLEEDNTIEEVIEGAANYCKKTRAPTSSNSAKRRCAAR
jgi:hypothetical protein